MRWLWPHGGLEYFIKFLHDDDVGVRSLAVNLYSQLTKKDCNYSAQFTYSKKRYA